MLTGGDRTEGGEPSAPVRVPLTEDEALVLFDFLHRFGETGTPALADQAEERALWNLGATLEGLLVPPLRSDYRQRLEAARSRLRDPVVDEPVP